MIYDDCNENWPFDLLTASAVGDEDAVRGLLVDSDPGSMKNSKGWNPIMFAAYFGHSVTTMTLISSRLIDVRDKNDKGAVMAKMSCGFFNLGLIAGSCARFLFLC